MEGDTSRVWQIGLLVAAGLFLVWEIHAGWRRGLVRGLFHFGAFVLSGLLGFYAGRTAAAVAGFLSPQHSILVGLGVGAAVTLVVLAVCLLVPNLLFKRTSQQPPGALRLVFGAGGALLGLLTGLFILWGGITLVRAGGAIAASQTTTLPAHRIPGTTRALVTMKNALEQGPAAPMVESVDILPATTYGTISRIGTLTRDPDAMLRFLDDPGIQRIVAHPRMQTLIADPDVRWAAENGDFVSLLGNPSVHRAATDPSLRELVLSVDLQKALDRALPPEHNPPLQNNAP
jgi:hypothetical protein